MRPVLNDFLLHEFKRNPPPPLRQWDKKRCFSFAEICIVFVTWLTEISTKHKPWLFVSLGSGLRCLNRTCCYRICLRPPEIVSGPRRREKYEASFFRGDVVILGFRVRLVTLQKFSSDHAPSKSPFDQSPPLLFVWLGFTAGEWPPAGVG